MELLRQEDGDKLKNSSLRIKKFHEEINKTFDKNLDTKLNECLDTFVDEHNLEGSEIERYIRLYNVKLKKVIL